MKWLKRSVAIILTLIIALNTYHANAKGVCVDEDNEISEIKTTAYTSKKDAITYSGKKVREGICAGAKWMVDEGDWVAMLWTVDGTEFLGYYELLDLGGEPIRKGYVIDVWFEDLDQCKEWMEKTEGKALVKYVKAVG